MFDFPHRFAFIGAGIALVLTSAARADLGLPEGAFSITISQDGRASISDTFTIGPAGDLSDLQAVFQDGDAESFTQIGATVSGAPIILKMTTDGDAAFRITHWYIDVPVSMADIDSPGPTSLFDPLGGAIDVTISGMAFDNGAEAMPFIVDNNSFFTSFFRDINGHFYETPSSNTYNSYGNGVIDVQVPGQFYRDGDPTYDFVVHQSGPVSSWTWENILPPDLTTDVVNEFGIVGEPNSPGYVFELGLAVAFIQIPEPGTIALLLPAVIMAFRRRR